MKKTAIALAMLIGLGTASIPAQAESLTFSFYGNNGGFSISTSDHKRYATNRKVGRKEYRRVRPLSPNRVTRILRKRGFYRIRNLRTNDRFYKARALNRRGNPVRIKMDAYSGKIVKRTPIRLDRRGYYRTQGWRGADYNPYRVPFWAR